MLSTFIQIVVIFAITPSTDTLLEKKIATAALLQIINATDVKKNTIEQHLRFGRYILLIPRL